MKYLIIGLLIGLPFFGFTAAQDHSEVVLDEVKVRALGLQIKSYLNFPQELDPESDEQQLVNALIPLCAPLDDELLVELLNRIPPVLSLDSVACLNVNICLGIFERGLKWLQGPGQNSERGSEEDLLYKASKAAKAWPHDLSFLHQLDGVLAGRVVVSDSDDDADGPDDPVFEPYEFAGNTSTGPHHTHSGQRKKGNGRA